MINILPPELKEQISFAKRNNRLLRLLIIGLMVAILLGALMIGSLWYVNRQITNLDQVLASRQQAANAYQDTETKVQALESNLNILQKLLIQKTHYSALLSDLASTLPSGAYINHLVLTGDDTQPMEILLTAKSFNQAAQIRNALSQSSRIKSADIQSITKNQDSKGYNVVIIVAFQPGEAR